MKLPNLAVIFLVISIPLIMIFSYYLSLGENTLKLQTDYTVKLSEATKDAVRAFEINTSRTSEKTDSKSNEVLKSNVQSAINTFISSMSNKMNLSGISKEEFLNYVPAIAVTM